MDDTKCPTATAANMINPQADPSELWGAILYMCVSEVESNK